jgi:hypothetical protein
MTQNAVILILVLYIVARETFFLYSTHKMVNKIMSHNFHDYQQSLHTGKPVQPIQSKPVADEEPEDIGYLAGMGIL